MKSLASGASLFKACSGLKPARSHGGLDLREAWLSVNAAVPLKMLLFLFLCHNC